MRLITSRGMSCWSGFWFFVSCHCNGFSFLHHQAKEMLSFHFPRVSNSRWPGDASSLVLLHEQFSTWSISYSRVSTRSLSRCVRSHLHFQLPSGTHGHAASLPPTYILAHTHRHIHTDSYKCEQRTFGDISRCSAWTSVSISISLLGKIIYL